MIKRKLRYKIIKAKYHLTKSPRRAIKHIRYGLRQKPHIQKSLGELLINLGRSGHHAKWEYPLISPLPMEPYFHGTRMSALPNIKRIGYTLPSGKLPLKYITSGELFIGIVNKGVSTKYTSFVPYEKLDVALKYAEKFSRLPSSKEEIAKEKKLLKNFFTQIKGKNLTLEEAIKKRMSILNKLSKRQSQKKELDHPMVVMTFEKPDMTVSVPSGTTEALFGKVPVKKTYFFVPQKNIEVERT